MTYCYRVIKRLNVDLVSYEGNNWGRGEKKQNQISILEK